MKKINRRSRRDRANEGERWPFDTCPPLISSFLSLGVYTHSCLCIFSQISSSSSPPRLLFKSSQPLQTLFASLSSLNSISIVFIFASALCCAFSPKYLPLPRLLACHLFFKSSQRLQTPVSICFSFFSKLRFYSFHLCVCIVLCIFSQISSSPPYVSSILQILSTSSNSKLNLLLFLL